MTRDVTDFHAEVLERSRSVPVVVDFWAAWCGPCRILGPVLERLAAEAGGRWELAKVDTEAHPDVASRYGIMSIPNVKLFVDGEVANEFVGALPESEVRRWLDAAIPSPLAGDIAGAARQIETGDFAGAEHLLRGVLEREPDNKEARFLLARALVHTDPARVAGMGADLEADLERADRIEAIEALARIALLADRPDTLPDAPVRARFLEGARAIKQGDFAAAFEAFIDVLREQRGYADGLAQVAGRAIVLLLGIEHPVCERFLRAFSSAVNA